MEPVLRPLIEPLFFLSLSLWVHLHFDGTGGVDAEPALPPLSVAVQAAARAELVARRAAPDGQRLGHGTAHRRQDPLQPRHRLGNLCWDFCVCVLSC